MKKWVLLLAVVLALVIMIISGFIASTFLYSRAGTFVTIPGQPAYIEPKITITEAVTATTSLLQIPQAKLPERGGEEAAEKAVAYSEQERMIAYTADISLRVSKGKVGETVERILSIATTHGGYLVSMSVGEKDAHLTVKVPQNKFFTAIEDFSRAGKVFSKSVSGRDVTDQIIDLKARIRNAEALEAGLLELLERAEKVSDMLEVMRELSKVREEIEVMKAELENIERSVAYSTITIWISEEEPKKEYVEILFKVFDSRDSTVPGTYLYVKNGEARKFVTDEFGEVKVTFERGQNITVIATFHRIDGKVLRKSLQDIANSNKTITIKFDKPSEPPAVNPDWISDAASALANYLVTGLMVVVMLVAPILFAVMAMMAAARWIYARIRPKAGESKGY